VALPLPYTVYERPSYSVVPSNALWRDPARADIAAIFRNNKSRLDTFTAIRSPDRAENRST
jgi:hypothetical protein